MQEETPPDVNREGSWLRVVFYFATIFWIFFLALTSLFHLIYTQDLMRVDRYVPIILAVTLGLVGFTLSPHLGSWISPGKILLPGFGVIILGTIFALQGTSNDIIASLLLATSGLLLPLLIRRGTLPGDKPDDLVPALSFQFMLLAPLFATICLFLVILLQVGTTLTLGHLVVTLCLISAVIGIELQLGKHQVHEARAFPGQKPSPTAGVQKNGIWQAFRYLKTGLFPCSFLLVLFLSLFVYAFPIYIFPYLVVLPDIVSSTLLFALFSIGVFLTPFLGALLAHSQGIPFDPASRAFRFRKFFLVTSIVDLAALGCFAIKDVFSLAEGILVPVGTLLLFFGLGVYLQAFFVLLRVKHWQLEIAVGYPLAGVLGSSFIWILVIFSLFFVNFFYLFVGGYILSGALFVFLCKRAATRTSEGST